MISALDASAIAGFIGGLATFIVIAFVAQRALKRARPVTARDGVYVLAYGRGWRVMTWFAVLLFAVIFVLLAVAGGAKEKAFILLGAVLFSFSLLGPIEMRARGVIEPSKLSFETPWRKSVAMAWTEIASVRYDPNMWWLVVRASDGRVMRFSRLLRNFPVLLAVLRDRAPDAKREGAATVGLFSSLR